MQLSSSSQIVLILAACFILLLIVKSIVNKFVQRYFQSALFQQLNRDTDIIPDTYDKILELSHKLKQSFYVNFSPSSNDEANMLHQDINDFKREKNLPKQTYLCMPEIIRKYEDKPYELLKLYCGFSNNVAINKYLSNALIESQNLQNIYDEFKNTYDEMYKTVESELPIIIKLFVKKEALLMLGMVLDKNWEDNLFPKYTFVQINNRDNKIVIQLDSQTLPSIIQYFN